MAAGDLAIWADVADAVRPPMTKLVQQALQALANATNVAITFAAGSEEIDTHNWHDVVTNNTRVTVTKTGRYRIDATVAVAASATVTGLTVAIWINGSSIQPVIRWKPNATSTATSAYTSALVELTAGQYVECVANQASGGALNTQASGGINSVLQVQYLGPL